MPPPLAPHVPGRRQTTRVGRGRFLDRQSGPASVVGDSTIGLLHFSEAVAFTWGEVELRDNGTALINMRRSKTDPEGEGVTLYIGTQAGEALQSIKPAEELLDRTHIRLWALTPPDRPESQRRGQGRRPGRGVHRPQRTRGRSPGPGQDRRRAAGPHDRRPVEEFYHAGRVHQAPGNAPGRHHQALPGTTGTVGQRN